MQLDDLGRDDKVVAGAGIVLAVDLAFLPWHSVDLGVATWARSAVEAPNALLGVLALLTTLAVVAVTLLRAARPATGGVDRPAAGDRAVCAGAVATLALLVVKLVLDTGDLGVGAWLGLLLAAAMTWGAALGGRVHVAE